jgi:YggT family protein
MDAQQISIFDGLAFQVPNLILAMLMYTMLGRFLLMFFFPPNHPNYIWRFFVRLTDPVLGAVRFVTPQAVPLPILMLMSVVWLFGARVAMLFLLHAIGLGPKIG